MGKTCYIRTCRTSTSKNPGFTFNKFPKNPIFLQTWIDAIQKLTGQKIQKERITSNNYVCQDHFTDDDYLFFPTRKVLKPEAVPSRFKMKYPSKLMDKLHNDETNAPNWQKNATALSKPRNAAARYKKVTEDTAPAFPKSFKRKLPSAEVDGSAEENVPPIKISKLTNPDQEHFSSAALPPNMNKNKECLPCHKKDKTILRQKDKLQSRAKEIKRQRETIRRLRKKVEKLETSKENEGNNKLVKALTTGKVQGKYPPNVRSLALTMGFYDQKTYRMFRSKLDTLPSPRTMRAWYSKVKTDPGLSFAAIDALKLKVQQERLKGKKIVLGALLMDEIAIRQSPAWDRHKKKYVGYEDFGIGGVINKNRIAKEALVFMVNAINGRFKIPVAYCFSGGITGAQKVILVKEVLKFLDKVEGLQIASFTFDGAKSNITMLRNLTGGSFGDTYSFLHPTKKYEIFILLDGPHMLKCLRNYLGSRKELQDIDGNPILWKHFERLHKEQVRTGLHFANKLKRQHIEYKDSIMNVRIAAQTLSERVAVAMRTCRELNVRGFHDSQGTEKFARMSNNSFDMTNSRNLSHFGYKKPLSESNFIQTKQSVQEIEEYLRNLKLMDIDQITGQKVWKKIWDSTLHTGPKGMVTTLRLILLIFEKYSQSGDLRFLCTYKLSQDHLEVFFSCIRSMGGFNGNPNAIQFTAAYKRLLLLTEVRAGENGNCQPDPETSILWVSSSNQKEEKKLIEKIPVCNTTTHDDDLPDLATHVITYIAGCVEKASLERLKCNDCTTHINNMERVQGEFIAIKSLGNLRHPTISTNKVCHDIEKIILKFDMSRDLHAQVKQMFYSQLDLEEIQGLHDNCRSEFLDCIFNKYMNIRLGHMDKISKPRSLRQRLNRIINHMGQ